MSSLGIPPFSVDLIKQLDVLYPDRCPDISLTDREIWVRVGQRSVVNHLQSILNETDEEDRGIPNVLV